jgi:Helix-turn-helix domain
MAQDFYTIEEIAALLRVRPGTVRNRISRRDADLPPSTINGRRRLFPVAAYEAWKQKLLPRPPAADVEDQGPVAK